MPVSRSPLFALLLALAPGLSAPAQAQAPPAPLELATFPRTSLEITRGGRRSRIAANTETGSVAAPRCTAALTAA